jgi:hypothetical protein
MPADEAKRELLNQLAMGRKVLPIGDCDNFSYETGCPGHPGTANASDGAEPSSPEAK